VISLAVGSYVSLGWVHREGMISKDSINEINCIFRKYADLVEALCNYHLTGNAPTGNNPDIGPYRMQTPLNVNNAGLDPNDPVQSQVLDLARQTDMTYTKKMSMLHDYYAKNIGMSKKLDDVMTAHIAARTSALSAFLKTLKKNVSDSEDDIFSTKLASALASPKVFSDDNGQATYDDLYAYFTGKYAENITSGYACK
jgi:hypothetical protein